MLSVLRLFLSARGLVLLTCLGISAASPALADERPPITLSVLQFGTAHWELDHLKRQQFDHAEGYELEIRLVANLPASRLAVTSGAVEGAVADLLWVQARFEAGEPFRYLPFSSQIGDVLVAPDSDVKRLEHLVGKRIGVAGGPDAKGWILLKEVASKEGLDLARNNELQYAAPPLLSQALKRNQLDVLITYWHFGARLRAEGIARSAFKMADLLDELGLDQDLPVLGYVFTEQWASANPDLLARFARSLTRAKDHLAADPANWDPIRPLMRAPDEAVFEALRADFVAGNPQPLNDARIQDLQQLLRLTMSGSGPVMPAELFYRPEQ